MGDLDKYSVNIFPNLTFTRPENIRIDKHRGALLTSIVYYIDGYEIEYSNNPEVKMFNHFIPTKSNRGVDPIGYGFYFNLAEYQISLKHLLGWRLDFIENYGQPVRVGITNRTGTALSKFRNMLANPSANQYMLLEKATDDDFKLEGGGASGTGTGWKNHGDCYTMLQKEISLLLLGHQDAVMTTPGKVGANVTQNKDGFNESTMEQAVNQKQKIYSDFVIRKINEISMPAFSALSKYADFKEIDLCPKGYFYGLTNDKEDQEISRRFTSRIKAFGEGILSLYNGGVQLSNIQDVNQFFPEFPGGFIKAEPKKELDEKRDSKTEIKKDEPGSVLPKV